MQISICDVTEYLSTRFQWSDTITAEEHIIAWIESSQPHYKKLLHISVPSNFLSDLGALMWQKLDAGAALFSDLWNAPVSRVAVENPVMHKHAKARIRNYQEFAQSVQPWQFGDWERKRTCFWLRGLPPLKPVYSSEADCAAALGKEGRPENRVHSMSPGADRGKERSRFFPSVARAMAEQWGGFALGISEIAA